MRGRRVRPPDYAPIGRAVLGGALAVGLVTGGILALQRLVPPERDSPAIVREGAHDTFTIPPESPGTPAPAPPTARATARPTPTASATAEVTARPAVTVLNNSRVTGLAAKAARDFAAGGWRIAGTGNLRGRLPRTTVYYSPGQRDDAVTLRRQFPAVVDLAPRYPGLPGSGGLTVVVTRDYPH